MSELFIATQDMSILNVSKIQSIDLLGAVMENNLTGDTVDVIEVAATMEFGDEEEPTPLGFYFTEEQALSTMDKLINWLSEKNEYKRVFRMPDINQDEEQERERQKESELDYTNQTKPHKELEL